MTVPQTSLQSAVSAHSERPSNVLHAAVFFVAAILAMFPHFQMGALFGPASYVWLLFLAAAALIMSSELALALVLSCVFFQNTLLAIVSPAIKDVSEFSALLGTSFAITILISFISVPVWVRIRRGLAEDNKALLRAVLLFFIVVALYSALGAMKVSPKDAIIYARVYFSGILMLIIGVAMAFQLSVGYVVNFIRVVAVVLVVWGIAEFFMTYELYSIFNVTDYLRFKWINNPGAIFSNVADAMNFDVHHYLNLSGMFGLDLMMMRPKGPPMHPITYAYFLAFCCLVCFIYRYYLAMAGCLALLVLIGAKGPMLLTFMSIVLSLFYTWNRNKRALLNILVLCLAAYLIIGLIYGHMSGDYHVVGFMGGVNGFLRNPLGHGVGVGGNTSQLAHTLTQSTFDVFQNYGAEFALESAFGVMLYQLGIGTAVFLLLYWRVGKNVWQAVTAPGADPRLIAVPVALAFLLINSVFQEEALSPCGWGVWLLLSGFLIAKEWKKRLNLEVSGNKS